MWYNIIGALTDFTENLSESVLIYAPVRCGTIPILNQNKRLQTITEVLM